MLDGAPRAGIALRLTHITRKIYSTMKIVGYALVIKRMPREYVFGALDTRRGIVMQSKRRWWSNKETHMGKMYSIEIYYPQRISVYSISKKSAEKTLKEYITYMSRKRSSIDEKND